MSVKINARYAGGDQVELEHGPSKNKIMTDLPVDNGGRGRTFSPTDLLASALASCILTIMAKAAERDGVNIQGTSISIEKHMQENPRRISKFTGILTFPAGLSEEKKKKLQSYIQACPVHRSLHPDIQVELA